MPLNVRRRKGSPFWQIKGTVAGERVRQSSGTPDKQTAQEEAARIEREIWKRHQYGEVATATFAEAVNLYLDQGGEGRFLLPLLNHFGKEHLAKITPGRIRTAASVLYPDAGAATWNRQVITPARSVVNCAHDSGLCPPIRVRQFKAPKPVRQAIGRAWLDTFRSGATSPYLRALSLFMFQTGARIGEAVKLSPGDLNLQDRRATFGTTKNDEPHEAVLTLEMVLELANLPPKNGLVFGYGSRQSVYGPWRTACKRARIDYIPPHQAGRHSFATEMMIRNRVDLATTGKLGNWKSLRLLAENYLHPEEPDAVIDEVFGTDLTHDAKTSRSTN